MKNKLGFTLIELIIAFGIFAMLGTATTLMLSSVLRTTARSAAQAKARNEGEYLMETISQRLRYATSAVCNGTSTRVTAKAISNSDDAIFFCNSSASSINRDVNDSAHSMNSTAVQVTNCSFTCSPTTNPTNVTVQFTVQDANSLANPLIFNTAVILRNEQ